MPPVKLLLQIGLRTLHRERTSALFGSLNAFPPNASLRGFAYSQQYSAIDPERYHSSKRKTNTTLIQAKNEEALTKTKTPRIFLSPKNDGSSVRQTSSFDDSSDLAWSVFLGNQYRRSSR